METMYTRLGTSQQPKLPSSADYGLLIVTRKPVTPLPMITAEKHPARGSGSDKLHTASLEKRDSLKKTDKSLSIETGKRVKRNSIQTTTVKLIFPANQAEESSQSHTGSKCRNRRTSVSRVKGSVNRKTLEKKDNHFIKIPAGNESNIDSKRKLKSTSRIPAMDRELERELEDEGFHGNCAHPHVTRVDILFKPVTNETSCELINVEKPQEKRRRPVYRQLTKQAEFGSKDSVFASTSTLPIRPAKQSDRSVSDEISDSTELLRSEGTWDSTAYTAKNTRIEFAKSLYVHRPFFVRRKSTIWSRKPQETKRICSRHLQHTRPVTKELPSPVKDVGCCSNQLVDPWSVMQTRIAPIRPPGLTSQCPKYKLMNITELEQNGIIGPSHPHMHVAAINSVYNWNRLSFQGSLTPPVSEADSLEDLYDFETLNLKMKMDSLIHRMKELYAH